MLLSILKERCTKHSPVFREVGVDKSGIVTTERLTHAVGTGDKRSSLIFVSHVCASSGYRSGPLCPTRTVLLALRSSPPAFSRRSSRVGASFAYSLPGHSLSLAT